MKPLTRILLLLAALILSHAQARPNKAIIRSIRNGSAQISTDGKTWKPARVGQQLGEHSAVKTDPYAIAIFSSATTAPPFESPKTPP